MMETQFTDQETTPFTRLAQRRMLKESAAGMPRPQRQAEEYRHTPAPTPTVEAFVGFLAVRVLEVLAGSRPVEHLASRVSDSVFRRLQVQETLAREQRRLAAIPLSRPDICVRRVRVYPHGPQCRECLVILESALRTRAVTMHIEQVGGHWRASSLSLL